ncbi:MAG: hypothetical protein GTN36_05340, partial [Candidatus Aenigmarchaeota archaeon]|nr:hypothetical protein [Candidatus Aenigmarchaeota archaeon]
MENVFKFLAVLGAIFFGAAQGILIPILIQSFKNSLATPYYILVTSSFLFALIFFIIYIVHLKIKQRTRFFSFSRKEWSLFFLTGMFDAFTGLFLVYASDATRTPIVMQTILGGSTIIFTMFVSKRIIESKRGIKLFNRYVIISLSLLFAGIIISTIPQYTKAKWNPWNIFWICIFLLGILCRALYNTLQERYMEITDTSFTSKITILFWTCFFQFIVMLFLFWADWIPYFGYSKLNTFGDQTGRFFLCYFSIDCDWTLLLALCFVGAYIGSYFSAIYLNAKSA